jgi:hypothetical protein
LQTTRFDYLGDYWLFEEEIAETCLAVVVGVVFRVVFADGWEENAACFAVADAEGAKLLVCC